MWCCFRTKKIEDQVLELEPFNLEVAEEQVQKDFDEMFN